MFSFQILYFLVCLSISILIVSFTYGAFRKRVLRFPDRHLRFHPFLKFFFYNFSWKVWLFNRFLATCGSYALFTDPQISLFNNFFIKNGFYSTIYTFKNYFATVFFCFQFLVFNFQLCLNGPLHSFFEYVVT